MRGNIIHVDTILDAALDQAVEILSDKKSFTVYVSSKTLNIMGDYIKDLTGTFLGGNDETPLSEAEIYGMKLMIDNNLATGEFIISQNNS